MVWISYEMKFVKPNIKQIILDGISALQNHDQPIH